MYSSFRTSLNVTNNECTINYSILRHVIVEAREASVDGPQTPPVGPSCRWGLRASWRGLRASLMGLRTSQQGLRAGWGGLRAGWKGLRASQQGLRASQQGLRASQRGDGRTDVRTDGQTDGISPHSTGFRPLSGPLPCYLLQLHHIKEAGQGYCGPHDAFRRFIIAFF